MRPTLFRPKFLAFCWLFLLAGLLPAFGQTPAQTVLTINPHVGEVIDKEEKIRFNLFPFVKDEDYQIGRFFRLPNEQIVLEVIKSNGLPETRAYTQTEFELTGQLIEAKAGAPTQKPTPQPQNPQQGPVQSSARPGFHPANMSSEKLTGRVYYVILSDGMKFFANITEKRANEYVFTTQYFGTITAAFRDIKYLKEVENKLIRDTYWIPNAHDSRLFFGPTGRGIPGGEGYFQTIWGYLNSFNYGVSDNFSIGTTFFLFPGLPMEYSVFSLTPKISLPLSKKTSVAAGVLYASFFGNRFGIVYGAGTYGTANDHLTAGLGYGFLNEDLGKTPVFMFGGVKRLSNRIALMSENYLVRVAQSSDNPEIKDTYMGGLYGVRFIWPRTNLDLGGFYIYDPTAFNELTSSYILPAYASFTFKIGNRTRVGKAF